MSDDDTLRWQNARLADTLRMARDQLVELHDTLLVSDARRISADYNGLRLGYLLEHHLNSRAGIKRVAGWRHSRPATIKRRYLEKVQDLGVGA